MPGNPLVQCKGPSVLVVRFWRLALGDTKSTVKSPESGKVGRKRKRRKTRKDFVKRRKKKKNGGRRRIKKMKNGGNEEKESKEQEREMRKCRRNVEM